MYEVSPKLWRENVFSSLDDEWMLVTAMNKEGKINTMTASWGGFGVLWGRPVCFCVIRPQRFTYGFAEEAVRLTLTFLKEGYREALALCGKKSGRDCDKIVEAGLHPVLFGDAVGFEEAKTVVVGRKIYVDDMKENGFLEKSIIGRYYPTKDFHRIYVCEIEKILTAEEP